GSWSTSRSPCTSTWCAPRSSTSPPTSRTPSCGSWAWCGPCSSACSASCSSGPERSATDVTDTDEVDFEIDGEELGDAPVLEIPSDRLSLLVNDLHVSYRVFGAKKVGHGPAQDWGLLGRLVRRGAKQPPVREVKAVRGISFADKHART